MKKKIILGVATLAITTVATINVNMSKSDNQLSALGLANVEALAIAESNYTGYMSVECKTKKTEDPITHDIVETTTKICSGYGLGNLKCEC